MWVIALSNAEAMPPRMPDTSPVPTVRVSSASTRQAATMTIAIGPEIVGPVRSGR